MIKIGDKFTTDNGSCATVIDYLNNKNITIQYDSGAVHVVQGGNLKRGSIKDPFKPSLYGVGILGIDRVSASDQGYVTWSNMLRRVYLPKNKLEYEAYKDCSVDQSWLLLTNFNNWFKSQIHEKGYHLDKDLLHKGNKVYSPSTCIFVPQEINKFLTSRANGRGKYPLGVSYKISNLKYDAKVSIDSRTKHLGLFEHPEDAFYAYKKAKEEYSKVLAERWKEHIDARAYDALLRYEVNITD